VYRRKERLRRDARDAAVGVEKERQVSVGYGPLDAEERVVGVGFGFVFFFVRAFFFARERRVSRAFPRRLARVRRALAQHRGRLALAERVPVVLCVYRPRGSKGSATVPARRTSGEKPSVAFADEIVFTL
jgi:hypothetical protein